MAIQNVPGPSNDDFNTLNSKVEIRYAGEKYGTAPISLPSGWKELYVVVSTSEYWNFTFNIYSGHIINTNNYFRNGYRDNTYATILVTNSNSINIVEFYEVGTSKGSSALIKVYYRV